MWVVVVLLLYFIDLQPDQFGFFIINIYSLNVKSMNKVYILAVKDYQALDNLTPKLTFLFGVYRAVKVI